MRLNQALITGTILTGAGIYKTWKDYKTAPQEQKKRVLIRNTAALGTAALAVFSVDRFMNKKFSSDVLQDFSHRVSSAILNNKFVKKIMGKLLPSKELQPVKFAAISDIIANCTNDVMLTASAALAGVTAGFIADKALYPAKNAKSNAVDTNKTQTTQPAEPAQPQETQPKKNNALIEKLTNEKAQNLSEKFNQFSTIASLEVIDKLEIDGTKLFLEDRYTSLLIRKSGTEPLLRFYIESDNQEKLSKIKDFINDNIN